MSRFSGPQIVRPGNDILTALLGAAVIAQVVALVVLFARGKSLNIF